MKKKLVDVIIFSIIAICTFISLKTYYLIWDYTDYGATHEDIYGSNFWLLMDRLQIYLLVTVLFLIAIRFF